MTFSIILSTALLDCIFLIDGSSNVGNKINFKTLLNFVKRVSHALYSSPSTTRVGIIVAGMHPHIAAGGYLRKLEAIMDSIPFEDTIMNGNFLGQGKERKL